MFTGVCPSQSLIKFLSEEGIRQQLLKTEGITCRTTSAPCRRPVRSFSSSTKQNPVELTEKGIAMLTANMEDDHFFTMPDVPGTLVAIDGSDDSDAYKRSGSPVPRAGGEPARLHRSAFKSYALFEKDVDYVVMDKVKSVDEQTGRIRKAAATRRTPPSHRSEGGCAH